MTVAGAEYSTLTMKGELGAKKLIDIPAEHDITDIDFLKNANVTIYLKFSLTRPSGILLNLFHF